MRLRAPATSANLGPGFDTLALALSLYLEVEAEEASEFEIAATGRNAEQCGAAEGNLLLEVYRETWEQTRRGAAPPLRLKVTNEIPLGMGCGSSAAARVTGVTLAAHFGDLGWDRRRIFEEAARLEGHPDNAAACVLGGFAVSGEADGHFVATSIAAPEGWRALLVIPEKPLATSASRSVLPAEYARQDAVANLQCAALLTAGFAQGDESLVRAGMRDRLHQPYRAAVCELLPLLLPLREEAEVLGVALSGAGPSVLFLLGRDAGTVIEQRIRKEIDGIAAEVVSVTPDASGLQAWSRAAAGFLPLW